MPVCHIRTNIRFGRFVVVGGGGGFSFRYRSITIINFLSRVCLCDGSISHERVRPRNDGMAPASYATAVRFSRKDVE
ncbi:mixed type I polyketide synthase/nonribosomal peptide synthetase [Anopheles sinensis]|uniref:Mixed type I polyketide synthase/nonribosomal peptide synthetase n=1 Tax=Anopheles sinensis TaxID=74873 RepID=A0A084WBW2_ANOSI|nr:mixed type I polyketide synthase/nonribosomal peptide synthetase [Anopheles sinensis]